MDANKQKAYIVTNDDPVHWHIFITPVAPFTNMV